MQFLDRRSERVLAAVVEDYLQTGEPVGSRVICRKYGLGISPATVRSVMADLEERGFLEQSYSSAGRAPTDRALRLYVDRILEVKTLSRSEKSRVKRECTDTGRDSSDLVRETSRVLSLLSDYTGVAIAPRVAQAIFRRIEFVRLRPPEILVVLISGTGTVQNRLVAMEEDVTQADLDRVSRYLNERLSDRPLREVKQRLADELRKGKVLCSEILERIIEAGCRVFNEVPESDVFVEGTIRILDHPEFGGLERMRALFHTLEDKALLVRLLDKTLAARKVQVLIGTELGREHGIAEVGDIAIITAPYSQGGKPLGSIGVIGPRRMRYSRVIPLVDYTAKVLSGFLELR